jgi:hypothetical protein
MDVCMSLCAGLRKENNNNINDKIANFKKKYLPIGIKIVSLVFNFRIG